VTAGYIYLIHCVVQYAYLPELTTDDKELTQITASSNLWQFATQVVFLIIVIGAGIGAGLANIGTARLSQALVSMYAAFMWYYSWMNCMKPRAALHKLPAGESLLTIGPKQIRKTMSQMKTDYPPVFWTLVSVSFAEAGANAFTTIAVTYAKTVLGMGGSESGLMILVCLLFAVPGSALFKKLTDRIGAHKSYMAR